MLTNTERKWRNEIMAAILTIIAYGFLKSFIGSDSAILLILGILALYYVIGKHTISIAMKIAIGFLILILGWAWVFLVLIIYGVYKLITR
jgi:hypothetical protein